MSDAWRKITIGELCTLTKGITPTLKAIPGQYPLVVTAADQLSSDTYQFDGEAVGAGAGFGDTYFGVYTGKPGCIDTKACTSSINSSANRAFWQAEMLRVGRSFGVHILHSSCQ